VRFRATTLGLTWAVCCIAAAPLAAQDEVPKTPTQIFRDAQDLIREGRFDSAAVKLKVFLDGKPTEAELLALMAKEPTVFQKLRNVPIWSEEKTAQTEALETVKQLIALSEDANKKFYRDPARINKFVRNLGASYEERVYAEQQLLLSSDAVVPVMIEVLRTSSDVSQRAGIFLAMSKLGRETVPGFLAAVEGLPDDMKYGILRALSGRSDLLALLSVSETDFSPYLWYYSVAPGEAAQSLREFAKGMVNQLSGGRSDKTKVEIELTRIAQPFVKSTARFRNEGTAVSPLTLWIWDPAKMNVTSFAATKAQAEDFYAVRYLKWALERNPNYLPAQDLFLSHTISRAIEKVKYGELAEADPVLFQVVVTAPSEQLINLLSEALTEQKTALALGLTQVLATRADKGAASSPSEATPGKPAKPSVFARALDYPDPRVQFAAAIGLLRAPVPSNHGKSARIVEILRRALAGDATPPGEKEMGRALLADPQDQRAEKIATYLRQLGYVSERFSTGRDLIRRVNKAADFDVLVVDRHTASPEIVDLLAQLRADAGAARRPMLLIASADKPTPVPLEHQLLRLAVLIAATDTAALGVRKPYAYDPRRPEGDVDREKADIRRIRDFQLEDIFRERVERMQRRLIAASLDSTKEIDARVKLRVPQFTYAALAAEIPITDDSAPLMYKQFVAQNTVVLAQPDMTRSTVDTPTTNLSRILEQLDAAVPGDRRAVLDQIRRSLDPTTLGVPPDTARDQAAEDYLTKIVKHYPGVVVVPEPYTVVGLSDDLKSAAQDPSQLPRNPADKALIAKIAVEWLRRMAIGEIPGYDVRPAEAALRDALKSDDLAPAAMEAVGRLPSAEAQQDLLAVAMSGMRPLPIRLRASELSVRHIQLYGRLIPPNMITVLSKGADEEKDPRQRAFLQVLRELLDAKPGDLGRLMSTIPLPLPPVKEVVPPPPLGGVPPAPEAPKN